MDRATGNDKVHSSVISESATCNEGAKKKNYSQAFPQLWKSK